VARLLDFLRVNQNARFWLPLLVRMFAAVLRRMRRLSVCRVRRFGCRMWFRCWRWLVRLRLLLWMSWRWFCRRWRRVLRPVIRMRRSRLRCGRRCSRNTKRRQAFPGNDLEIAWLLLVGEVVVHPILLARRGTAILSLPLPLQWNIQSIQCRYSPFTAHLSLYESMG